MDSLNKNTDSTNVKNLPPKDKYFVFLMKNKDGESFYSGFISTNDKDHKRKIREASDYFENSLKRHGIMYKQMEIVDNLIALASGSNTVLKSWDSIKEEVSSHEKKSIHELLQGLAREGVGAEMIDGLKKDMDYAANKEKFEKYMEIYFFGDEQLKKAFNICIAVHSGEMTKGFREIPYYNHPIQLANMAIEILGIKDSHLLQGLLLHDTVEDTDLTQEELENIFDTEVMSLVDNVTKREDETREEYMKRVENTTDLRSKIAKCIDRYHNLIRSFSMNTQNYNNKKRTFKEYLTKYVKESEEVYAPAFEKIKELEPLAMKFFRTLDEVKLRLSRMD